MREYKTRAGERLHRAKNHTLVERLLFLSHKKQNRTVDRRAHATESARTCVRSEPGQGSAIQALVKK